jgi:hypothetical protein
MAIVLLHSVVKLWTHDESQSFDSLICAHSVCTYAHNDLVAFTHAGIHSHQDGGHGAPSFHAGAQGQQGKAKRYVCGK